MVTSVVIIDILSKYLAFSGTFRNIPILNDTVKNRGITFGLFQGINFPVVIIGVVLIIGLLYFRYKNVSLKIDIITAFLVGGALGNIYDRLRLGYVRDFIQWPTFNLADVFICVGVAFFIIDSLYHKEGGENG